jgi:uncharacterized RDD family membrane protein YckC
MSGAGSGFGPGSAAGSVAGPGRGSSEPVGELFPARQVIRSPEQVALDLDIAGPMSRVLAFSIDYGLILLAEFVLFLVLLFGFAATADLERFAEWAQSTVQGLEESGPQLLPNFVFLLVAVWIVMEFALQWGYFVACELLMQGRSPGKAALGLRVVRDGGLPIGLRESMVRNLMRIADMLPPGSYFIGLFSMVISSEHKRLGDYAAGTLVVRDGKSEPAAPIVLDPAAGEGGGPDFRFDRSQLEAVGGDERRLIRQTLRRLDQLSARRREQVLERAAGALRQRIGLEEEIPARDRRAFLLALLRDTENL